MSTWADIDERDDHYLGLAGANVVATEALLMLQDDLADTLAHDLLGALGRAVNRLNAEQLAGRRPGGR